MAKELISVEKMMEIADKKINDLPVNKIKNYLQVIEKMKAAGIGYKEIAETFEENGIPVKPYVIKNIYLEAHPEKKRQRGEGEELEQTSLLDDFGENEEKGKK